MPCENCGAEVQLDDGKVYACRSCGYEFGGAVSAAGGLDYVATSYANTRRKRKHVCRGACREHETRIINRESVYCNTCDKYMRLADTTQCPCCGNARIRRKNRRHSRGIEVARY